MIKFRVIRHLKMHIARGTEERSKRTLTKVQKAGKRVRERGEEPHQER